MASKQWNETAAAENWSHVIFVGFYWVCESVYGCVNKAQSGFTMCDTQQNPHFDKHKLDDAAVLPEVTAHVHSLPGDLMITWIPYYDPFNSVWAPQWRKLGFDLAVLQPHVAYAGSDPSKVFGSNDTGVQFDIIADMVSTSHMGVEMEVAAYTRNNLPPDEESWMANFQLYLQAAKNHSWSTDALKVWYTGSSFLGYWRDTSCYPVATPRCNITDSARRRRLYDEAYWMIQGSWPNPP